MDDPRRPPPDPLRGSAEAEAARLAGEGWCACGHSHQMHDPNVGCLVFECPCTPGETIDRLLRRE